MTDRKRGESKAGPGLATLLAHAGDIAGDNRGPAPVHLWNPPDCGPVDIRIDRNGDWHHEGRPIRRAALMRLFSRVIRREADGSYVLVTPVERFQIAVDDVPFVAVEMEVDGEGENQRLSFRTNAGDVVTAGPSHPLRFETDPVRGDVVPYVLVRPGLEARLARPLLFELVEHGAGRDGAFGVISDGVFFAIGPVPS